MSDEHDDHEPAVGPEDAGQTTGAGRADPDDGDDGDPSPGEMAAFNAAAVPGTPVREHDPSYRRVINDSTRALFKAMPRMKPEDFDDGMEVAIDAPEPTARQAQAQAQAQAGAAPAATTPPAAATPAPAATPPAAAAPVVTPAPVPDARASMALDIRERAIGERETAFADREKALEAQREDIAKQAVADFKAQLAMGYFDRGADAINDLIKDWTGVSSEDDLRAEWEGLIGEGSGKFLKIAVEPEIGTKINQRRALHKVSAHTAALKRQQEAFEAKVARQQKADEERRASEAKKAEETRKESEEKAAAAQAHRTLDDHFRSGKDSEGKPIASFFPHLMAEEDPAGEVIAAMRLLYQHHPDKDHSWSEAAGIAEEHWKKQHEAQYGRISKLFTPTPSATQPAQTAPAPTQPTVQQGAPQGRGARTTTLTNGTTAPVAPAAPKAPTQVAEEAPYDAHTARKKSWARLQADIAKRQADDAGATG